MNGIEKITARIEGDASAEAAAILREAEDRAARIRAEYEEKARSETQEALARGERAAREREERLASMTQLECRKAVLSAKRTVIDRAFDAARQKLLALPEDEYAALLADLAVKASSTGRESLIFSRTDRARVGRAVVAAANEKLAKAAAPKLPGEVTDSRAGAILDKVVAGASALLNGTAMLSLAEETRPMDGGFVLSNGAVEVNCTFDALIRLRRDALAGEVAKVLFE